MNPRTATVLILMAAFLTVVAVYGERVVSRQTRDDRVTVVYWEKWTGSEGEEMRKVVDAFNASQDRIFVKYLSISGVDTKMMLAASGGSPPDVAGVWQERLPQFADAGALTDLTELAAEAGLSRDYYIANYYDSLTYRGRLWALPSTPASIALHVRRDLVPEEYASVESFPKTFEELDALAFELSTTKANGSLDRAFFLPSSPGWWNWAWPGLFGGSLLVDGEPKVNTPEAVRAFEWIERYAKRFGAREVQTFQSGFGNFASPQDPFMDGKTATELNGVWKGNYIRDFRPGLDWFAVPIPYPADRPELEGHSILSQDVLVIPKGAMNAKEAFEFIRFVQRQDVMEGLCSAHGKNSPLNEVSEKFFEEHPNPEVRLFDRLARSENALVPPNVGIFYQMSGEVSVAFQEVSSLQKTPRQALDDAQARVEKLWGTYRRQVLGETE